MINASFLTQVFPRSCFKFRKISLRGKFNQQNVCNSAKNNNRNLQSVDPVSFHKRDLPDNLISFSSKSGKEIFKESLSLGTMECFFPLSEQFITQSEPSYCALSSLAMVLNSLNHDPQRIWKGVWRWVSEEMLHCETKDDYEQLSCGHSINNVKKHGMSFAEFEALGACHGVTIDSYRALGTTDHTPTNVNNSADFGSVATFEQFEQHISDICRSDEADAFCIVNFSRKILKQTGDGHFSPIGGYNPNKRLVLILDTARFKYPPFWVPISVLWESMTIVDKATQLPRGYFVVSNTIKN